ncbi:MAG: ATP-binding cassette domain-containing protein, partial [Actinomycetes bacterium]|nr:ATP-binding cassette domain-containing protein [Actinomycetes bacterium]
MSAERSTPAVRETGSLSRLSRKGDDLIAVRGLEVTLNSARGPVYAVRDINLKVQAGEIHGIVGESGCGKTMTATSIMRLNNEKALVYAGEVLFEGRDLMQLREKDMGKIRGRDIAMI